MSEPRVLLDTATFMDSAHAVSIGGAATPDIREIVQRFLASCYEDAGVAPRELDGDGLRQVLVECLPRRFGVRDPLAEPTEEILGAYLEHLIETQMVVHAFELRQALAESAESFRIVVRSGDAHGSGIAVTGPGKTVKHRAEKTGRNDPCPCGSGAKFKKCCGKLGS